MTTAEEKLEQIAALVLEDAQVTIAIGMAGLINNRAEEAFEQIASTQADTLNAIAALVRP